MTTTESNITKDMTPVEAANLLAKLEDGHQVAWLATREVPWQSAEYESRFQNAAEIDGVFRDVMWETLEKGMRRPGEPVEEFAERAESEARLADAGKAGAQTAADLITQHTEAGMTPERAGDRQDEIATWLLTDASTPEGQAYARAFSETAATYVRELRERDPLPEPDRTPGTPTPICSSPAAAGTPTSAASTPASQNHRRCRRPRRTWRLGDDGQHSCPAVGALARHLVHRPGGGEADGG